MREGQATLINGMKAMKKNHYSPDKIKEMVESFEGDCINCHQSTVAPKWKLYCSERCAEIFEDTAPIQLLDAYYKKINNKL